MSNVKLVVVGDEGVGKTCLLVSYVSKFPVEYVPKIFDPYATTQIIDGEPVSVLLCDGNMTKHNSTSLLSYV